MPTKIEWAEEIWNPVTGCSPVSEGCQNCYAKRMANRLRGRYGYPEDKPFKVTSHPDRLDQPLKWKKPRRIFVCSMGDLFHKDVPFSFICDVFARILLETRHTFLILTKRPERMKEFFDTLLVKKLPLPNVWLGVTAENQDQADLRIPILLEIPAKVRFVSVEPMLTVMDLEKYLMSCEDCGNQGSIPLDNKPGNSLGRLCLDACIKRGEPNSLDWVICGAESGYNARPMQINWARNLKDQCEEANVYFFLKQMNVDGKLVKMPELDGHKWNEYPMGG